MFLPNNFGRLSFDWICVLGQLKTGLNLVVPWPITCSQIFTFFWKLKKKMVPKSRRIKQVCLYLFWGINKIILTRLFHFVHYFWQRICARLVLCGYCHNTYSCTSNLSEGREMKVKTSSWNHLQTQCIWSDCKNTNRTKCTESTLCTILSLFCRLCGCGLEMVLFMCEHCKMFLHSAKIKLISAT